ncbi:hypothetical protein [Actinomyces howellii]|uniref:ATP-dependent transcriptional regulator n=1 Tax=Actinomyces howellii TaxID=52771 RepID=A0A448HEH1_9ACTO|nr:hypothetical protein [Actinomyces howellii]VEG26276.1 Uncharacterised protein [Actinomyces howellii]
MTTWEELPALVAAAGDPRSPAPQRRLFDLLVRSHPAGEPSRQEAVALAEALGEIDRTWLAALGEDPVRTREEVDQAVDLCRAVRTAAGESLLPLRFARIELCTFFGEGADALEMLREARLFSHDGVDASATLAAARLHDDYSGVIRTTTAVVRRHEADPAGTARSLSASLLPYLAQGRKVEAEDALMALEELDVPDSLRLRLLGDRLEYLGLSGQWERGLAVLRHTELADTGSSSAWALLNAAVGASLVLRAANRAGYGANALGATLRWATPWTPPLQVTGWDTVVHAYDAVTSFVRSLAVRFDARNGNNGVSYRQESRMAAEPGGLSRRSYGTVTAAAVDQSRLPHRASLLSDVNQLLVLARGYGLQSVHERAVTTAETVSESLACVTDDSQLETVVDLRVAFARLLLALGAGERAELEALDTAELCLSQGWIELASASVATAARAAGSRGDDASRQRHWDRVRGLMADWGSSRTKERISLVVEAVGDPATAATMMAVLGEALAQGVEEDTSRASAAREACKRGRELLGRSKSVPDGVEQRLDAVERQVAPFGRGRGGRHRAVQEEDSADL